MLVVLACSVSAPAAQAAPLLTTGLGALTPSNPATVAFSPDGALLATANVSGGSVTVFSVSAGGVLRRVGGATGAEPVSVAFSPNGKLLAVANSGNATISMFGVGPSGVLTPVGSTQTGGGPTWVEFSPNGKLLAVTSGLTDSVWAYSVSSVGGLTQLALPAPTGRGPSELAFRPDGKFLATVNENETSNSFGTVSLLSVAEDGTMVELAREEVNEYSPEGLSFSRDGRLLAVANQGWNVVSVFGVGEDGVLDRKPNPPGVAPDTLAFSPADDLVAVADNFEPTISMHRVDSEGTLTRVRSPASFSGWIEMLAFSQDGRRLAAVSGDVDMVSLFSVSREGVLTRIGQPTELYGHSTAVAFRPGGHTVASAISADDGWEDHGISMLTPSAEGVLEGTGGVDLLEAPSELAFAPDGQVLAAVLPAHHELRTFALVDGGWEEVATIASNQDPQALAFDPSGTRLAVANRAADSIAVYAVSADGQLGSVQSLQTGDAPTAVAFSPDGRLLVAGSSGDGTLSRFSVPDAGLVQPAGPPVPAGGQPLSIGFSRDGALLASANTGASPISIFTVSAGVLTRVNASVETSGPPTALAFSPQHDLLASVSPTTRSLDLYRVSPGGALTRLGSPTSTGPAPTGVSFSSDGQLIAVGDSLQNMVLVYPLAAPNLATSIESGPPPATGAPVATLTLDANYPATFECSLDDGPFQACPQQASFTGLDEGEHTVRARARDPLGNVDGQPARWTWNVDRTPPQPPALEAPANGSSLLRSSVTFRWHRATDDLDALDHYELWIDGVHSQTLPDAGCSSLCPELEVKGVGDGAHTWHAVAVDVAGNRSEPSASRSFSVDGAPPAPFELRAPVGGAVSTDRRPTLSWATAQDAGVGLTGYDVLLDDRVVAHLGPTATSFTPAEELSDGVHRWQVVASDAYENRRESAVGQFSVDNAPPVARLTAAPNPALAGRKVSFDASASTDAASAVVRYEWDLDGDRVYERESGGDPVVSETYPEPGTYAVQVRVTDRAGFSATARADQRVSGETRGRGQLGVSINEGARFTNDPKVTISADWPTFASEMLVSNDGGFKDARALPLRAKTTWTLDSSGTERLPKIVYVRFVRGLTVSETYTDDVILDERAPFVSSAHISRGHKWMLLRLHARDRGLAGLKAVQVANDRRRPRTRFRAYGAKVKLATRKGERAVRIGKPVFVRVRDRAGNVSSWRPATRPLP